LINPDILNSFLKENSFVSKIHYFDESESTNDFIKNNDLDDGSLVITNFQKNGKGRFQRKWESERGKNLSFSIFKKFDLRHDEQINLVYLFSYSIYSVIKKHTESLAGSAQEYSVTIKWPNDILLNKRKIAGILIETKAGSQNYIVGIGINVNQLSFKNDNADKTTSLMIETKKSTDLNELLFDIIRECQRNSNLLVDRKLGEIYSLWKNCTQIIGEEITYIASNGVKKTAVVDDFLPTGNIILSEKGKKYMFNSNEISLQF